MSDDRRPQPGQLYWNVDDVGYEIAEVLGENDDGTFIVVDDDGEEAEIGWSVNHERWEVNA